nr:ABC transporter substrate-binding protein [Acidaminobacter sp. JC074]
MNPDVADVFSYVFDGVVKMDSSDQLAPIDAKRIAGEVGGYEDYDSSVGGNLKIDDRYLGFPMNIETLIMFVNTANSQAHGIDISGPVEFNDLSPEDMLAVVYNGWFGVAYTNTVGLEFLDKNEEGFYSDLTKDFSDLREDQQELFTSLFNYYKAHEQMKTDLWDNTAAFGYLDASFVTGGQTSLRLDGPWATPSLIEKTNGGADIEVLPIGSVVVNGKPLSHWQSGWALGANIRLEGEDEKMFLAEELIKELINPEYAGDFFKATGKILPNVSSDDYLEMDLDELDKKVIASVIESYENALPRPMIPEWDNVWGTWESGMLSWSAVKPATVEEAYELVQASFISMMKNLE